MNAEEVPKSEPELGHDSVTRETRAAGVVRVHISGEVDLSRFEELDRVLASADADCSGALEIDLGAVSFMDSQGLKLLLRARERVAGNGRQLVIVDPSPSVQRLFWISGLSGMFRIEPGAGVAERCPCCSGCLGSIGPPSEHLRPGDGWCPECRWVLLEEVLAGGDWPIQCPTHGRSISR